MPPRSLMWWWWLWLVAFYAMWLSLNIGGDYWAETVAHWPMAAAMALGSFVAGSTPMGGGTIGFPVLVLLFDMPPAIGRNFGFAIQSIGMVSASIFILCRRIPVEVRSLLWSIPGAAAGLLLGNFWLAPHVPDTILTLLFACLWLSFAAITLAKNREFCALENAPRIPARDARLLGLAVGTIGGATAALVGVGIDMMLYTLLVLLYRSDLKVAVPTSVVIMAITSLMGVGLQLSIGAIEPEVFPNWLAAAPVVILGAPLGAYFVKIIPRQKTLFFVSILCVIQFLWAIYTIRPTGTELVFVINALGFSLIVFHWLYQHGKRRAAELRAREPAPVLWTSRRDPRPRG